MTLVRRAVQASQRRRLDLSDVGWGPYSDGSIPPNSLAADGSPPISEGTARQLIDAYACITLISDTVSMLPFGGYRKTSDYRVPLTGTTFYDRPDPEIEQSEFIGQLVDSLAVRGRAYCPILDFDRRGYPTATRVLHPDDVMAHRATKGPSKGQIIYELRNGETYTRRNMIHIRLHPVAGQVDGMSPIECARRGLRMAVNTEQFGDRWFTDGAAPSSVLETEHDLDDREARKHQARWIAAHGGRRRPAVLSGGLKWRAISITPNESQFLETRKLNTAQTARIWRVAPHLIGDVERTTSWGTGIEQLGIGFVVYTLGIYLRRIEDAFSSPLVSPRDQYAKFNVGALLRGDAKNRYDAYAIGRQWGWLSVNDIRRLEDLEPIEGGDTYLQPLNMVDAEQALAALKLKSQTQEAPA